MFVTVIEKQLQRAVNPIGFSDVKECHRMAFCESMFADFRKRIVTLKNNISNNAKMSCCIVPFSL